MAEESQEEKTEEPSDKKRRDQREEGMVAFSKEIPSVAILGSALLFFYLGADWLRNQFSDIFLHSLNSINTVSSSTPNEIGANYLVEFLTYYFEKLGIILLPAFLLFITVVLLTCIFQVGFEITWKPLQPKLEKLSPLRGIKQIFSLKALKELMKSLLMLGLIGYIGYLSFSESLQSIFQSSSQSPGNIFIEMMQIIALFCFRLFLAFVIVAIFDYGFQRWDHEQKIKMSLKEVKEENKQVEGDPIIKQRIREAQKKMSQGRMLQDVPQADVVLTNPTHYAVAIQYDRETMNSPRVIAKGSDHLAFRIIEIAKESKVSVVRNPTAARGLFAVCEIGDDIPEEFFKVVAKILAYVYKQKGKIAR